VRTADEIFESILNRMPAQSADHVRTHEYGAWALVIRAIAAELADMAKPPMLVMQVTPEDMTTFARQLAAIENEPTVIVPMESDMNRLAKAVADLAGRVSAFEASLHVGKAVEVSKL
jgi:hypothetical protein